MRISRLLLLPVVLAMAWVALGTPAQAVQQCKWFGSKPFCNGQCPKGWSYTGQRESCTSGSRRYCCREVAQAPVPQPAGGTQMCQWFGKKPFCDGKCPANWVYTGQRQACTTGSRRYCCASMPSGPQAAGPNGINVLAYNVYLRPTSLFKNGQSIRAGLLPGYLNGYDAIIFSEVFDDDARNKLLRLMTRGYPHATRVVGRDRGAEQDGGVMVVSRYPITAQAQRTFGKTCLGTDCQADKGVIYARINKDGKPFHIFGSHTQSTPDGWRIRQQQFQIMRRFIDEQKIPPGEPVLIGGDLNVDKAAVNEHRAMLNTLNAEQPPISGHPFTFDPRSNKLAASGKQEYLDYVLFSKGHQRPKEFSNTVLRLRAVKAWKEFVFEKNSFDLSDHYPVLGKFRF